MRLLALLLLVGLSAAHACAQSSTAIDSKVVFKVTLASNQREFRMGEVIPLQLSFSSAVKNHYELNMAQYDRSGRMEYEQFNVSPSESAVDPLARNGLSVTGGITSYQYLSSEPWTINLYLNDWVRFTQPGEYRLVVFSNRVAVRDPASQSGSSVVAVRSNEITFKIVKADAAWQKRTLNEAVAKLNAPRPRETAQFEQYDTARKQAVQTLRSLGTAAATRELVKQLGRDNTSSDYLCMIGIVSSPERAVARVALEEALADPDQPIDDNFLYTLHVVSSDPNATEANWREVEQRGVEQLLAALPGKRGKALSISLSTAVDQALNLNTLPPATTQKLMGQLISMFDQLSLEEQNTLLRNRWEQIRSPALLPLLKRYAQAYRDRPQTHTTSASESLDLSGYALRRWYELDPEGARSAVIAEISRPSPRFDARVLGLLPDKTLPEVEFVLAGHFATVDDYDAKANLASLIARYASDAILPQVLEQLEPRLGKWACAIQNPILAYVLRVSPATAQPIIEKAIAARGAGFSGCNHFLLQTVSDLHYDPMLEELAVKSLDDPDPQLAATAAIMLAKFGSPESEAALRKRFTAWAEQWTGREAELDKNFAIAIDDNVYQITVGQSLAQALAIGRTWLTDKDTLQSLAQQTKVRLVREQLDNYLRLWDEEPLSIFLDSSFHFHASVAQYQFDSFDALKEKLTQFPPGTRFAIILPTAETSPNEKAAELRNFLTAHGMFVAPQRDPH